MKTSQFFCKKVPSNINIIGSTVKSVIDYLHSIYGPLNECDLFEVKVILNELILNAIKHGNKEDDKKFIKVSAELKNQKDLFLVIEDSGEGYDYDGVLSMEACTDSEQEICNLKETGRGLLIVKNLCDEIKFNKKGNKVIVVKSIGTN
ncbi:MAG TPA: ATP-binding protein [Clostridiaceae bacterium]|nr:ATP-binding protein [Clostridiaceae bacterium]